MHPKYVSVLLATTALAVGTTPRLFAQASQPAPAAPKSSTNAECRGNGCAASADETAADSSTSGKPYDWKVSFKEYKVGKVPRLAGGHPDLQGIWSRAILVPME